jgi:hypothetical protein
MMKKVMMKKATPKRLEQDDRPLDHLDRLVGGKSPHRQIRIVTDVDGKIGLLAAVRPQRRRVRPDIGKIYLVELKEKLIDEFDLCPGLRVRPVVKIQMSLQVTPQEYEIYQKWVDSVQTPAEPLTTCTST